MNKSLRHYLDNLWLWKCEMPENHQSCSNGNAPSYDAIASNIEKHWMPFLQLQFNRLVMGAFRYGQICEPGKPQYDRTACIGRRLIEYRRTGNDELLVDIANLAFLEMVEGCHKKKHFSSVDDGEHTQSLCDSGKVKRQRS